MQRWKKNKLYFVKWSGKRAKLFFEIEYLCFHLCDESGGGEHIYVIVYKMGFPGGSVVKNPPASVGNLGSISGLGRSPGVGNGNPL